LSESFIRLCPIVAGRAGLSFGSGLRALESLMPITVDVLAWTQSKTSAVEQLYSIRCGEEINGNESAITPVEKRTVMTLTKMGRQESKVSQWRGRDLLNLPRFNAAEPK
jgi:hypothetical protein